MMKKQKEVNCSKQDLLRLVNGTGDRRVTAELSLLIEAEEFADLALKEHEESDVKLQQLRWAADRAGKVRYRKQDSENKARNKEARLCRNAIYLEGATENTVAMVRKLLEKYGD